MKKVIIVAAFVAVLAICLFAAPTQNANADYLRIHIRADSNAETDQTVKYAVKAAVVEYLTPKLARADSKAEAMAVVMAELTSLEQVANTVLADKGFAYKCHARIASEKFPCRTYGNLTLESGIYDALILDLGSGRGNNWWCVVYPPLCFVGGENNGTNSIVYRSLLKEVIDRFFARKNAEK